MLKFENIVGNIIIEAVAARVNQGSKKKIRLNYYNIKKGKGQMGSSLS